MTLAEIYYAVAGDLELQAANLQRTAEFLNRCADQLSEQAIKERQPDKPSAPYANDPAYLKEAEGRN